MRRFAVFAAAAAILVVLVPSTAFAATATRFTNDATFLICESETESGFVFMDVGFESEFGDFVEFAFWESGAEPFESDPTWVAEAADVTGDASGMSGTLDLVAFDPTTEPPFGSAVGTATLEATFEPDGAPAPVDERNRTGNSWERIQGTDQALLPTGELALPNGDTVDVSTCHAAHQVLQFFGTNPAAHNERFGEFFVSCDWEVEDGFVGLFARMDSIGSFGDVFVGLDGRDIGGGAEEVLTSTALTIETPLFDFETGDEVGSASAAATLASTGERQRLVELSGAQVTKIRALLYTVHGSLEVTIEGETTTYPIDDEHCFSADQRGSSHEVIPGGPPAKPLANDAPDDAQALKIGRRVRIVTGANAREPEATCTFVNPEDPSEIFEVPISYTAWYTVAGTGGPLTVDTVGSPVDTVVAVYRQGPDGLEQVDCVDDVFEPNFSLAARLTWPSEAGVTYWIQVGGYDGSVGRIDIVVR